MSSTQSQEALAAREAPPAGRGETFTSDEEAVSRPVVQAVPRATHLKVDDVQVSPWVHFFAGGVAGMVGAIVTSPLDVVKTRLQSREYADTRVARMGNQAGLARKAWMHVADTFGIMRTIAQQEGGRALFRGLGPNLAGVVPARSVNFFTYGLTKDFLTKHFSDPNRDAPKRLHLLAGISAGVVTSTVTNPIWLIKTRLQLDRRRGPERLYKNSLDALVKIVRTEGVAALYRGLSASYLGTVETSLQWMLYERMKLAVGRREKRRREMGIEETSSDKFAAWFARSGAAGAAKLAASLITYPHEVVRTRLREAPLQDGRPKYRGLVQCFTLVLREEGFAALYGGLTAHLLRTVPNSIIMFGTWDLIVRLVAANQHQNS